jgi:hypothetical protein
MTYDTKYLTNVNSLVKYHLPDGERSTTREAGRRVRGRGTHDGRVPLTRRVSRGRPLPPGEVNSSQRHHPGPELALDAGLDVVLAHEIELAVGADTEHREAGREDLEGGVGQIGLRGVLH